MHHLGGPQSRAMTHWGRTRSIFGCCHMVDRSHYRPISQDELSASLAADRKFEGRAFPPDVSFDDLDCTKAQFADCLFQSPSIKGADFSEAAFRNCKFLPSRFASCKFADAQFTGCSY